MKHTISCLAILLLLFAVAQTALAVTVATPAFSPTGGSFTSVQTVRITDATSGAVIYYTTNGTTPTATNGIKYTTAISVAKTTTLKAVAIVASGTTSAVSSATYTIKLPTLATPTFSLTADYYTTAQTVTISEGNASAAIYYTTNGTEPTTASTKYTAAITVSATTTLKAIAVLTGYNNSAVATATYTIDATATGALSALKGDYTCQIAGYKDASGAAHAVVTHFTTDGAGKISAGTFDAVTRGDTQARSGTLTGSYTVGKNYMGTVTVATNNGVSTKTQSFVIGVTRSNRPATAFRMIESDDAGNSPSGQHSSGYCLLDTPADFTKANVALQSYAFELSGESGLGKPKAMVGRFTVTSALGITGGVADLAKMGDATRGQVSFATSNAAPASITAPVSTTGRFVLTLTPQVTISGVTTTADTQTVIGYMVNKNVAFLIAQPPLEKDRKGVVTEQYHGLFFGEARRQLFSTFGVATLKGNVVVSTQGISGGSSGLPASVGDSRAMILEAVSSGVLTDATNKYGSLTAKVQYRKEGDQFTAVTTAQTISNLSFSSSVAGRSSFVPTSGELSLLYFFDVNKAFMLSSKITTGTSSAYISQLNMGRVEAQSYGSSTATAFAATDMVGRYAMSRWPRLYYAGETLEGSIAIDAGKKISGAATDAGIDSLVTAPVTASWAWENSTNGPIWGTAKVTITATYPSTTSCILINNSSFVCVDHENEAAVTVMER